MEGGLSLGPLFHFSEDRYPDLRFVDFKGLTGLIILQAPLNQHFMGRQCEFSNCSLRISGNMASADLGTNAHFACAAGA
jgi:hypothetical protein